MRRLKSKALFRPTAVLSACLLAWPAAYAQIAQPKADEASKPAGAQASDALQTIVVSGERRLSTEQKTAQAISAVTGDDLAKSGVVSALNLSEIVPGVDANQGGGFSQVRIRGAGGGVVNNFGP